MLLEMNCYRTFLSEELARRTAAHPRYSQRAFGRDLGMSPGELSEVLQEKRKLSVRSALKVARYLSLNATETKHLLYLVQLEEAGEERAALEKGPWQRLEGELPGGLERFKLVSDWTCFAVLNLSECENFRSSESWIARRLGISAAQARVALGRLERAGLAKKVKGRWSFPKADIAAPEGVPSESIRAYHAQILERAARALQLQPVHEREFAGVGFAADPKELPAMKRDVAHFLDEMVAKYAKGKNRTEVFQLELALFRLTEGGSNAH
jgi:uncharacterized protein (TIGR02147 family)